MRILALVEDLRINKTSAGICNSRILNSLLQGGHTITCLYDYFEDDNFGWLKNENIEFEEINNREEKKHISLFKKLPKSNALPAYTTGFSFDELRKIKSWKGSIEKVLINNSKYDFIFVLGAGNSNLNFFAIKNVKTKTPYIVNYHDPYPIHQYPKLYAKPSSHVGRLKAKASNKVMNKAFKVSFPSQRLKEWMSNFHPILLDKSFVLPHVFSTLKNLPISNLDNALKLDREKFNILHMGSLLGPRNPTVFINVFNNFIEEDTERSNLFLLNIVGNVARVNKEFDKKLNLKNVNVIKERVSYAQSLELLKQADVVLILEANSEDNPFMPGKLADCISVEKPILALSNKNSETARILGKEHILITDLNNEKEIYNKLSILWEYWKENRIDTLVDKELTNYVSVNNFNEIMNKETETINA